MKLLGVCLVLIVGACNSERPRDRSAGAAKSTGPGVAGIPACQALVRALERQLECAPAEMRESVARMRELQRSQLEDTTPIEDDYRKLQARACALQLGARAKYLAGGGCAFELSAVERGWVDAERGRRTAPPAGATPAGRDVLEQLAGLRDRTCACKDAACAKAVSDELDAFAGSVRDESIQVRDAASAMIDELGECQRRAEGY